MRPGSRQARPPVRCGSAAPRLRCGSAAPPPLLRFCFCRRRRLLALRISFCGKRGGGRPVSVLQPVLRSGREGRRVCPRREPATWRLPRAWASQEHSEVPAAPSPVSDPPPPASPLDGLSRTHNGVSAASDPSDTRRCDTMAADARQPSAPRAIPP